MRKICHAVFSPDIYKFVLLAVAIANVCPLIGGSIAPGLKRLHLYAAAVIAFDLLGEKRVLKNKGRILLVAFVLCYCVTILCNPELLSFSGVSFFAYLVETLLLAYSYGEGDVKWENGCLFVSVLVITLASVVGIVMFYTKFCAMPVYDLFIGMYPMENRLAGLFGNPNSLGLICMGAICLCFIRLVNGKGGRGRAFYAVALVIDLVAMLLSNCRTAIYACVCMVALYAFLFLLRDSRSAKRAVLAVVAAVVVAAAGYFGCTLLQRGLSLLDVKYSYYFESIMQPYVTADGDVMIIDGVVVPIEKPATVEPNASGDVPSTANAAEDTTANAAEEKLVSAGTSERGDTIRRFMNVGLLNDRGILWSNGAKLFVQKPLFGYGLSNYYQSLLDMGVEERWAAYSMHNSYLEALVSFGLTGFACAVLFLIVVLKNAFAFFRFGDKKQWRNVACLLSCVAAFLAAGMMESALAAPLSPGSVFFWIIMAMLMQRLEKENRASDHFRPELLNVWIGRLKSGNKGKQS